MRGAREKEKEEEEDDPDCTAHSDVSYGYTSNGKEIYVNAVYCVN